MSKPERLDIRDGDGPVGDILSVWDAGLGLGHAYVKTHSADGIEEGPLVLMNREQARQLFNWLGVWLHT